MSSRKPKNKDFSNDIQGLLPAAEVVQREYMVTPSSDDLGACSLKQGQPHMEVKKSICNMSQSQKETSNPVTLQKKKEKAPTNAKIKEEKDKTTDSLSHPEKREKDISLPKITNRPSNSVQAETRNCTQKKSSPSSEPEGKLQLQTSHGEQEGLINRKQMFARQLLAKQELSAGLDVVEKHEKKLQKELKKLSEQSGPSRDRLVVFSDVFDDVCEGLPVFGRILREIKTDYDLYVNHLMDSMFQDTMLNTPMDREMALKDAEDEVCRLEQEVKGVLEDNRRLKLELENLEHEEDSDMKNQFPSQLEGGCIDTFQSKRLQVFNMWEEIQQLEEEFQKKLVSTVRTTAVERGIKDTKKEIMRLIARSERLETSNKELEDQIHKALNREKVSKATRRMLWEEIHCDLQME